MIDLTILRASIRLIESAAVLSEIGREGEALKDIGLAIDLLRGAARDSYDDACREGVWVTIDDGEARS